MQAELNGKDIQDAIKVLLRLAAPSSGNLMISVSDSLIFYTIGNTNSCKIKMNGNFNGEALFAVPIDSFREATKNRQDISLKYKNTVLYIKSGNYKTELATVDAMDLEEPDVEYKDLKVNKDQTKWLKTAVSKVALKPNIVVSQFMPCGVKINKKAYVGCFDITHVSFTQSREIQGDIEFVLPLDTLQSILDTFSSGFKLSLNKSHVKIKNKFIDVIVAIPDVEENMPTLSEVINQSKEALDAKGKKFIVNKQDILAFLDNAKSVSMKERSEIDIKVDKNSLNLEVRTIVGSTKSKIQCKSKGNINFKVDFDYFDEMIRKAEEDIPISVIGDSYLVCESTVTTIVGLNQ